MLVWRSLVDVPAGFGPAVAAIGVFDGVHRGHQAVLRRAREIAAEVSDREVSDRSASDRSVSDRDVVAVTFDPHPLQVLAPDRTPVLLTDLDQRARLLTDAGATHVLALPFDSDLATWSPREFVQRVVVGALHADVVVVGENFRFGHRATGDVTVLRELGAELGFGVEALDLAGSTDAWSSTYVRDRLVEGSVEEAAQALGRWFSIEGVVVRGDQRGRQLGYPTANVPTAPGAAVPADGVYAGWLRRRDDDSPPLPAAVSVGTNPTFAGVEHRVESYVLDRDDLELYGVRVEVSFVRRLRGQVRFDDVDALVRQMDRDCGTARAALAAAEHGPLSRTIADPVG